MNNKKLNKNILPNMLGWDKNSLNSIRLITDFEEELSESTITLSNLGNYITNSEYAKLYNWLNCQDKSILEDKLINVLYVLNLTYGLSSEMMVFILLNEITKYLLEDENGYISEDCLKEYGLTMSIDDIKTVPQFLEIIKILKKDSSKLYKNMKASSILLEADYLPAFMELYPDENPIEKYFVPEFIERGNDAYATLYYQSYKKILDKDIIDIRPIS